ncbi:acyl-CoA dehydrogenase [Nocardia huaxiensis]|uniref:Broad-specificity linear acyl-CoA dehydrogenase FadE5 n=1 Tax=Nocardia huaxiensis TaxID=2755382 RepID=A0A7D6ZLW3_9NOCA|nr:acyl-CoA dehydrogenase [Nocardia huaxiensis]QLY28865.1 acyl-CoA dehydrogenase [Nocardia huaxiensis]
MGHYRSNVRDLEFTLFEMFGLDKILASGAYGDLDGPTVRQMLTEAAKLAEGPVAEGFSDADRNPPTFDAATHTVRIPESFKKALRAWQSADWFRVGLREEVGGVPAPAMVTWAITEFLLGAQPGIYFYLTGPVFSSILHGIGTEEQQRWATLAVERNWGTTMVLTEPDAGSDVGAGRTRAIPQPDGSWHIEGVKRFITSADSDDLFENIAHLVLARPSGAGPGTKGLSLFYVPKFHFDTHTGELGDRNGAFVTGLEHKMGLKVSATCEITFGAHGTPAKGWLIGDTHNGIAQMFQIIETARMMVGTKAIATLSTGYLNALDYARHRIQGADLTHMADKNAPRVPIIQHPDVRRSLMMQKAYAEGLRAVYLFTAAHHDPEAAQQVSGADPAQAARLNDLLLPIAKGVGSERAYAMLTESLQTLGGSGYLQDYPIEQYIRDAKIDSLYEGTTAIQAQDFFFRKIARDGGATLEFLLGKMDETVTGGAGFTTERRLLGVAVEDVRGMAAALTGYLAASAQHPEEIYKVGTGSVRFLLATGDLLVGWLLLRQAEIAAAGLAAGGIEPADAAYYSGKVAVASFFAKQVLPTLSAVRTVLADLDNDPMVLDISAF